MMPFISASATTEVSCPVSYFRLAWQTSTFTPATEIRKLYPSTKQWIQLRYVFNGFKWVIERHFEVAPSHLAPKDIKTIQNVADAIQGASQSANVTKTSSAKVASLAATLKAIA